MKEFTHSLPLFVLLAIASCQNSAQHAADTARAEAAVRQRVDQLGASYSHKDGPGLVALTDPDGTMFYGTDSAEINVGKEAILQQMQDDFATVDSLRLGTLSNYRSEVSSDMATAFFDAPVQAYSGGHRYRSMMRFATVWRKHDNSEWYLTQALVSRPTTGESSREMALARQQRTGSGPAVVAQ